MYLGRYRLLAQLEAGADGVVYRGWDSTGGRPGEVRLLNRARGEEHRWQTLVRRLRLAALLSHEAALAIRELGLEHEPPYVVLEWVDGQDLADAVHSRVPLGAAEVVVIANDLGSV